MCVYDYFMFVCNFAYGLVWVTEMFVSDLCVHAYTQLISGGEGRRDVQLCVCAHICTIVSVTHTYTHTHTHKHIYTHTTHTQLISGGEEGALCVWNFYLGGMDSARDRD
jgi:hypothetical protein